MHRVVCEIKRRDKAGNLHLEERAFIFMTLHDRDRFTQYHDKDVCRIITSTFIQPISWDEACHTVTKLASNRVGA